MFLHNPQWLRPMSSSWLVGPSRRQTSQPASAHSAAFLRSKKHPSLMPPRTGENIHRRNDLHAVIYVCLLNDAVGLALGDSLDRLKACQLLLEMGPPLIDGLPYLLQGHVPGVKEEVFRRTHELKCRRSKTCLCKIRRAASTCQKLEQFLQPDAALTGLGFRTSQHPSVPAEASQVLSS